MCVCSQMFSHSIPTNITQLLFNENCWKIKKGIVWIKSNNNFRAWCVKSKLRNNVLDRRKHKKYYDNTIINTVLWCNKLEIVVLLFTSALPTFALPRPFSCNDSTRNDDFRLSRRLKKKHTHAHTIRTLYMTDIIFLQLHATDSSYSTQYIITPLFAVYIITIIIIILSSRKTTVLEKRAWNRSVTRRWRRQNNV